MKSFVNKFIYIRTCLNYSYTKEDLVFNARNIGHMRYCHQKDQTTISFAFNNYDKHIEMKGNKIPELLDILNRNYTKGCIIDEKDNLSELL
jgi:hypothetical protein